MLLLMMYSFKAGMIIFSYLTGGKGGIAPERGNPNLPTVSQSRLVPLAVGTTKIMGPNVLEASPFKTTKNKIESSGLFGLGGTSETVGFAYHQSIEMAIAYGGPTAELYKIYWGNILGITLNFTGGGIHHGFIKEQNLFGNRKTGEGGVTGNIEFIGGDSAGHLSRMKEYTGREQAGMPNLARCIFYKGRKRGFYWGNSPTFKPVSFIYGFYPNPFGEATKHRIGNGSNPAYVLYEIVHNGLYGAGSASDVNVDSIKTLADLMVAENMSFQRTWYETSENEIENELLEFMDAVRYRSVIDGSIHYKALRDDYDVDTIPHLTDNEIIKLEIECSSISVVATRVAVEYLDEDKYFEPIKVEAPNIASRQSVARETPVIREYYGASNATLATKLAIREARKATKPRKQGKLQCNRAGWDLTLGDTILITKANEGVYNLPVRIIEHSKGSLQDNTVTIKWIEEVFAFGTANYGIPNTGISNQIGMPAEVTDYFSMIVPAGPFDDGNLRFRVWGSQPATATSSLGFILEEYNNVSYVATVTGGYGYEDMTIDTPASKQATTLVLDGSPDMDSITLENSLASASLGINILVAVDGSGQDELLAFSGYSYDDNTELTTLTGVYRGLGDTVPLELANDDVVWFWNDGVSSGTPLSGNPRYKMRDYNDSGNYPSPTSRTYTNGNRYLKPAPPANVKINGTNNPASATGALTVSWVIRDKEKYTEEGWQNWYAAAGHPLPTDVTYNVKYYDDDLGTLLQDSTGLTASPDTYTPISGTNIRVEVTSVHAVHGASFYKYSHIIAYS